MSANAQPTLADILPVPATTEPATVPEEARSPSSLNDKPTASHALAIADTEENGTAQQEREGDDVVDLGWKAAEHTVPEPLVARMSNDELWVLLRRFNKVWLDSEWRKVHKAKG